MKRIIVYLVFFAVLITNAACGSKNTDTVPMEYPNGENNGNNDDDDDDDDNDDNDGDNPTHSVFAGVRPRNALITDAAIERGRQYDVGNEAWRIAAEERIERDRKGDMNLKIVDAAGNPIANADVKIEMTNHEFGFGGSLDPSEIINSDTRKQLILDMFNVAVFGNNMKWRNDAQNVHVTEPVLDWLVENGIQVRAHALFWMAWKNLPNNFEEKYKNDIPGLKQEMEDRCNHWVPFWGDRVREWDVFNEPWDNQVHEVLLMLGMDVIEEYLRKVRALQPGVKNYINDYGLLTGGNAKRDNFTNMIKDLQTKGAPIDGIGMQLYPGGSLNFPNIISRLQHWSSLDVELFLTEFSYLQANVLPAESVRVRDSYDMLLACFSFKACKGFIWWGPFGANAIIAAGSGQLTETGAAMAYLLFEKWWTNTQATTDADGEITTRVFHGDYKITVEAGDKTKTVPIRFFMDGQNNSEIKMD